MDIIRRVFLNSTLGATGGIFQCLKEHDQFYHSQINEARIILLAPFHGGQSGAGFAGTKESYRGMFRLLSEEHIPFASMANLNWIGERTADLVITTGPVPAALQDFVRGGGNLLVTGTMEPDFEIAPIEKRWKDLDGAYIGIGDKTMFPALGDTDIAMIDHEFVEVQADRDHPLTFIPPSLYAPPEYVGKGWADSGKPALVIKRLGKGTIAWLPWDISGHYYRYSLESHRGILTGLIDHLLPKGRDIQTNAHPLVQMSLMRQNGRHQLHLVNMSGHSDTAYFEPSQMRSLKIAVRGEFAMAIAVRTKTVLAARRNNGFTHFELPSLNDYELIVLS